MSIFDRLVTALNVKKNCDEYGLTLWQCPQFLFIVMGFIVIVAIIVTNITARLYTDPEIAALIVLIVAAFLFTVGTMVVRAFEEVATASIAKSEFISIVSHEMRNPLSTVKWQLNLLEKTYEQSNDLELKESLTTIADQNAKAIRLVNELIESYRVEDKKLNLSPAPFSLKMVTERVVKDFEHYARASNISLSFIAPDNLPAAFADAKRIQVVIEHLLDNAIRYSEGGGEITISLEQSGARLVWTVSDRGVGIPQKELNMVFAKFFRSHNRLRYHTNGLGLGLYLAREIIRASKGDIWVRSIEGRGTTFWFSLPTNPLG